MPSFLRSLFNKLRFGSGFWITLLFIFAFVSVFREIKGGYENSRFPKRGEAVPVLTAPYLNGDSFDFASLKGKVVLIDFWATWCPPCVAALPKLERLHQTYQDRGFLVLGVNQERGMDAAVQKFVSEHGLSFPNLIDTGFEAQRYGVFSFPTSFLVNREGLLIRAYRGMTAYEDWAEDVESALGENKQ